MSNRNAWIETTEATSTGIEWFGRANYDYDGLSDLDDPRVPGRGVRDVEDLTMLSGLTAQYETKDSSESDPNSDA